MAKVPQEVIDKVRKFIIYLENSKIPIETALIFGSYAKGTYNKWSDIDVALVSSCFDGNRFKDLDKLTDAVFAIDTDISPLPYRPEDFVSDDLFVKEILTYAYKVV